MKTNPGLPICPNCGRRFNDSDFFDPTFASDVSFVEAEYKCFGCGREGNVYFDFSNITLYEEEVV